MERGVLNVGCVGTFFLRNLNISQFINNQWKYSNEIGVEKISIPSSGLSLLCCYHGRRSFSIAHHSLPK